MSAKNRLTISLDDAEFRQIHRMAAENGISASHVVRQAIAEFINHRDRNVVNPNTQIKGAPNPRRKEYDINRNLNADPMISVFKSKNDS